LSIKTHQKEKKRGKNGHLKHEQFRQLVKSIRDAGKIESMRLPYYNQDIAFILSLGKV